MASIFQEHTHKTKSPSDIYLAPCNDVGNAILSITCTANAKHFIAEVFEEVQTNEPLKDSAGNILINSKTNQSILRVDKIPPKYVEAAYFLSDRFKHGARPISRKGVLHPIYELPITDYTVQLINKAWTGQKRVSEMAKPFLNKIFLREFEAEQNAKRVAEWRANGKIPTSPWFEQHDKFLKENGIELNAYQKVASFNGCKSDAYSLFADPGLGKTAMMIRILDHTIAHHTTDRPVMILITCPKTIRTNWMNELEKFSMFKDKLHFITLRGGNPTDRFVNFCDDLSSPEAQGKHVVVVTGYESWVQSPMLHNLEFDLCLMDESHSISNPSTKRTKTFLNIRGKFHKKVIATGTPFRNSPFDIYAQLEFLGEGYSGFDSFESFKRFYGCYESGFNGKTALVSFQNIPLMQEKLAKHAFIIRKEEALPFLPKKTGPSILECNLSHEQLKVYLQLAEQLATEFEGYGDEPDSLTVTNILTQMLRLAQITSGFAQMDSGLVNRFDPNPKLDLLVKMFKGDDDEELPGILTDPNRKAIVWCCFKENLKMVHARMKLEGIKSVMFHGSTDNKDEVINQYNCDPETKIFIGIAASGGVGLNLVGFDPYNSANYTTNTTDTIYYSSNWSYVVADQAENRGHRFITRVPLHISHLCVPDSIDMEIYNRIRLKKEMSMSIQDIRKILLSMIPRVNGN